MFNYKNKLKNNIKKNNKYNEKSEELILKKTYKNEYYANIWNTILEFIWISIIYINMWCFDKLYWLLEYQS